MLAAIEKFPQLHCLRDLIKNMPTDEELAVMEKAVFAEVDAINAAGLESAGVVIEVKQPAAASDPAPVPMSGSRSITVRVPAPILNSIKKKATQKRMPYQTFINRLLRAAALDYQPGCSL